MLDTIEALERLDRLREQGAITADEFERQKATLLEPNLDPAHRRNRRLRWGAAAAASVLMVAGLTFALVTGSRTVQAPASNLIEPVSPIENEAEALAPVEEPNVRTLSADEQLARAFEAAFGARGRATRVVEGQTLHYRPGGLRWVDDKAILVSPGQNAQDCHACGGTLAVHYLAEQGGAFVVEGEWLDGGGYDDWGSPPEWRFSTEVTSRPALRTEGGGGNQGIFCTNVSFYELASNGPVLIADIRTGHSSSGFYGEGRGTEISGTIRNVRRDRSFEVHYTGTETLVERWVRRGGAFQLEGGTTRVPEC